ncbi:MAG: glycoside hydrolase family 88/105 protein [Lachnospiraceae bacterium]
MRYRIDDISQVIDKYLNSFEKVLYEEDSQFMEGMKKKSLANDDIRKYQFWEWTQGVGLFGVWKLYKKTKDSRYMNILTSYYERQLETGLPAKNVNTVTPLLAMSYVAEELNNDRYMEICREWAEWIFRDFPRTTEGGLQHITSDTLNEEELWDDTLFMTVLFLANMGRILNEKKYQEEAEYQFLLHVKYLADKETGLWYHGWSFKENSNFAKAFWGRGNCWVTAAIPEFLGMVSCSSSVKDFLIQAWRRQVETLLKYQDENGMWHTLIDDADSYVESSATCGFAYGILKGVSLGFGEDEWAEKALKAMEPILRYTDDEGVVHQVSYGTPMGRTSKSFYKEIELKPMPYGQALAMLFFMESQNYSA